MIHIVLADDHQVIRKGVRDLLATEPGITIVAEASDGFEAVRVVEEMQPNVLVVDISMPGFDGLAVTREVRMHRPETQVVVLTMHAHEAYALEALRRGAVGYVLKDADITDLVQAIRKAAVGKRFLSSPLAERFREKYNEEAVAMLGDSHETLSGPEKDVLQLTAQGHTAAQVAERLSISQRMVEAHRANLMQKLGLTRLADIMRYAIEHDL